MISVAPIVDKVLLTQKFDLNVLTPVEAQQWVQMADQEVKKCGSMNFPDFDSTKTDVLKEINSRIEQGKC